MKFADLQGLVAEALEHALVTDTLDAPSLVNRSLTHGQALDILAKGLATFDPQADVGNTPRGELMRCNVERECEAVRINNHFAEGR